MHKRDVERFGKCDICLEIIPIENYFRIGDEITCHECSTECTILSKDQVKLTMIEASDDPDDYSGEMKFE